MNHQRIVYGTRGRPRMLASWSFVVLAALFWAPDVLTSGEVEKTALEQTYDDAQRLASEPESLEAAMAKYRSVVEIHRANEKLYKSALRRLAQYYGDSGRVEEGVRFFITMVFEDHAAEAQDVLRKILREFQLKHPEIVQETVADMGIASRARARALEEVPSEELAKAILQRKDKELREGGLKKLREMLSSESPDGEKRKALATLAAALTANFDREPFRSAVRPLLTSKDQRIRALAVRCFPGLGTTSEDLSSVIPLADDASADVRAHVASTLIQLGKGKEEHAVIPALIKLLRDPETKVVEQAIRSMWGQYSSPEFDTLLIELSREPPHQHNVIYHCLSTMRTKSAPVCRRLVEELDDPDWNNSGRAAWGLTYGVVDEAKSLVEEGLLRALPEEANAYTRTQEFRALRDVATEGSRPYLNEVVDSELETEDSKRLARQILDALDSRR